MDTSAFRGGIPALMTPCNKDRSPDFDALVEKAKELLSKGMNSVVDCSNLKDGLYHVNYDNKDEKFIKK